MRGRGVALEQRVLGLRVERGRRLVERHQQRAAAHEPARERELLPLAERHLDAPGPGRPELRVEARRRASPPRRRRRRARRRAVTADSSSMRGSSPRPTVWRARNSKRKKSWNAPATRSRQPAVGIARERRVVHVDRARRGRVHLRQQLDQRRLARAVFPDDGDHGSRRQLERSRRPATSRDVPGYANDTWSRRMPRAMRRGHGQVLLRRRPTPRSPRATPGAASRTSRSRAGTRSRRRSAPMYADRREPAASTSSTPAAGAPTRATKTMAPT